MGKRGASKQLTQDNPEDDEDDAPEGDGPFRAAAPEKLQQRQIKGLPSRKSAPTFQPKAKAKVAASTPTNNGNSIDSNQEAEKQRYISLRGLNVSAVSALQTLIDKDPFVDLQESLKQLSKRYSEERETLEKQTSAVSSKTDTIMTPVENTPKPAIFQAFSFTPAAAASSAPSLAAATSTTVPDSNKETEKKTALPTVPTSAFSFAGKPVSSTPSQSQPSTGGFVFDSSKAGKSENSAFALPSSPATSTKSDSPTSVPALAKIANAAPLKPSPLRAASSMDSSPVAAPKPAFSFGAPSKDTTESKEDEVPKKTNAFSGFSFGSAKTETPKASTAAAFTFGGTPASTSSSSTPAVKAPANTSSFGFGITGNSPPKGPTVGFSFGMNQSPYTAGTAPPFTFGDATPSTLNPSPFTTTDASKAALHGGFDFSGTPAADSKKAADSPAAAKSPFSFAMGATSAPPSAFSFGALTSKPAETVKENDGESPAEAGPDSVSENPFAKEGEGEEDEKTTAEIRARLHKFVDGAWKQEPVGVFKVKESGSTGKTRILGRNATNSNIMMNFLLYPNFKMTLKEKTLLFVAFDGEEKSSVRLTVKDKDALARFKEAAESGTPK